MSCHSSVTARRQSQSEQVRPHREQPSISSWLRVMAVKELPEAEIKDRQDTYAPAFNSFHPSPILCDSSWPFTCLSVWALCDERQWHWSDYEMLLYWTKTKGRQHKVWRMEIYCLMQLWQPGLKVAWMWFLAFIMCFYRLATISGTLVSPLSAHLAVEASFEGYLHSSRETEDN